MDARRWGNVERTRRSYEGNRARVEGLPHEAFLEISSRCNLRCQMCPISFDTRHRAPSGRPAFFQPELFDRLRPLFPTLLRAHLYGLGEPVLNPHLESYIAELSRAGVEVWFTTNATLIDEERARAFARAGADRISVSVDGATARTYEQIRVGARFESLLRGIEALAEASRQFGKPRLTVNFVAMTSNVEELPDLVSLVAERGVQEINVEPLFDWGTSAPELEEHYRLENLGGDGTRTSPGWYLEKAFDAARQAGVYMSSRFFTSDGSFDYRRRVEKSEAEEVRWICSEPWATVYVTAAGEVRPCCMNDSVLGNLHERSIEEIWNDTGYRRLRRTMSEDVETPRGCIACRKNGRVRHSPHFAPVEPVSYRPRLSVAGEEPPGDGTFLDPALDGEVVTDPLVLWGCIPRLRRHRFPRIGHRWLPHLLIDDQSTPFLGDAVIDGGEFVVSLPVPYLTEGSHLLSLDRVGAAVPGWSRRTVHFWRCEEAPGGLAATRTAAAFRPLPRPVRSSRVLVDGTLWPRSRWLCGRTRSGWVGAAVIDIDELSAGWHRLEVEPDGLPSQGYRLFKLPVGSTAVPRSASSQCR